MCSARPASWQQLCIHAFHMHVSVGGWGHLARRLHCSGNCLNVLGQCHLPMLEKRFQCALGKHFSVLQLKSLVHTTMLPEFFSTDCIQQIADVQDLDASEFV